MNFLESQTINVLNNTIYRLSTERENVSANMPEAATGGVLQTGTSDMSMKMVKVINKTLLQYMWNSE